MKYLAAVLDFVIWGPRNNIKNHLKRHSLLHHLIEKKRKNFIVDSIFLG